MKDLLHELAHRASPVEALVVASVLSVGVLVLLRRWPWAASLSLLVPATLAIALTVDLGRLWPQPRLMAPVSLATSGTYAFPLGAQHAAVWEKGVCFALQIQPGLPCGLGESVADVTLWLGTEDGQRLETRRMVGPEWGSAFRPKGDQGVICATPPERFAVGVDVRVGDPMFADLRTTLALGVPRHDIVCPERLVGTAFAASGPLWLGSLASVFVWLRRRRAAARVRGEEGVEEVAQGAQTGFAAPGVPRSPSP